MALSGASPASAVSANGSMTCSYVTVVTLRINSSASGQGSWQNRKTTALQGFNFPPGASVMGTNWLSVNWVASTPGYFYSQPSARCGS